MFLASRTLFRLRTKRPQPPLPPPFPLPPPPSLSLKCLDTHQRILFRVSLYKFISKETWYGAPNIPTVAKYQETVNNLYVSDSYSLRQKKYLTRTGCKHLRTYDNNCPTTPVHMIRCNLYHTILLYYYVETNKIIHTSLNLKGVVYNWKNFVNGPLKSQLLSYLREQLAFSS